MSDKKAVPAELSEVLGFFAAALKEQNLTVVDVLGMLADRQALDERKQEYNLEKLNLLIDDHLAKVENQIKELSKVTEAFLQKKEIASCVEDAEEASSLAEFNALIDGCEKEVSGETTAQNEM